MKLGLGTGVATCTSLGEGTMSRETIAAGRECLLDAESSPYQLKSTRTAPQQNAIHV